MRMPPRNDVPEAAIPLRCVVCGRRLEPARHDAGPVMYWALFRDGALIHICAACHSARDGGVKVVAPNSLDDRWMPLLRTD